MRMWTVSILLMSLASQSYAYNILMLTPFGSWSESQLTNGLANALAEVGHHVTHVSGFKRTKESPVTEIFVGSSGLEDQNIFELDMLKILSYFNKSQKKICNLMYTNKDVLNIWKNRKDFDAIIALSLINEITAPFLMDYHGTYIGLSSAGLETTQVASQGNRLPKSVTPFIMVNFDENMNFLERVMNLMMEYMFYFMYIYNNLSQAEAMLENYFPGMPPVLDLYTNFSLLLINSHFAMDGIYPLLPNQVEIGTLTTRLPQPLPKDLRKFVDGAENGVIYFSLGQLARSMDIPKAQMEMLLEALRHLPQHVVWKYEGDHIENLPSNVITKSWLPQQDILGHPKTLVFISHCGTFGTQEAKYHGVPVLGLPISFDQHRNAARLARKGYGRVLNWNDMTVESIIENINILIKDTSYQERMKVVSAALQDQMESPKERAVWWIEYAIRHKDAPHMHYAGKNLNGFQYHMIDVWALLIAVLMLWISLSYWCLRRCINVLGKNLNVFQNHIINVGNILIAMLMLWISLIYGCLRRCINVLGSKSKQE